jgi:AcrR family transcriptional regulator
MTARDALIDATKQLLSSRGFEATSPAAIQQAANVGQGSFYHHFAGKADLANAALSDLARDMCEEFDQLESSGPRLVDAYLEVPRNSLAGCRIGRLAMERSLDDDRIREPVAEYFCHVRAGLTRAFDALDLDIDSTALADLALAAVQGAYVTSRATDDPSAMARTTDALRQLIAAASTPEEQRP